jgi:DUF971 family protein
MTDAPDNIHAQQSAQVLEMSWADGSVSRFPYRFLRGECPCAACRDEWTGERRLDPNSIRPDLGIEGLENVGSYALRIGWNDGHSSGIYTWESLRRLANELTPES